jgi:hypothetical protein
MSMIHEDENAYITRRGKVKLKDPRLSGLELDAYIGEDGAVVIHIDTPNVPDNSRGPQCRIYLNDDTDDPLWDNA